MLTQREINVFASGCVPRRAWDNTVAIVIAHDGGVHQFGSGILFRVADYTFVITAAHVVKRAVKNQKTLGISNASGSFVTADGQWLCSSEGQFGSNEDPFDVAVKRIGDDAVKRLSGKEFLRFDDIDFAKQSPAAVYTLFGFPAAWSEPSITDETPLKLKGLQYTTYRYDRETTDLQEYQERIHLLLDAQYPCSDDAAEVVRFQNTAGEDEPFPGKLGGISGCSVWRIGDLKLPIHSWTNDQARIVAVQTGVYASRQAIKASLWVAVSTLLYQAFPELRPAISLLRA